MSSLTMPSAVTPTLPALNIHPHGHGHKKASPLDPTARSTRSRVSVRGLPVPLRTRETDAMDTPAVAATS